MPEQPVIVIPPKNYRRELKFSGDFKESIFGKTIMPMPTPISWADSDIQLNHDSYNKYTLNNYNYRGPDFSSNYDVLTAGCSQTFGIGVPDDGPWPVHVSEMLNASYVNVSMPGASIEWIIDSIYRYIDTFGKPIRGIIALFPDILRHDVVINSEINDTIETSDNDFIPQYRSNDGKLKLLSYSPAGYPAPNYLKKPYPIENTMVLEESVKASITKIKDLERFCKAAGVNLVWSSWADSLVWLVRGLPEKYQFENYVKLNGLSLWKSHLYALERTEKDPEGIADIKLAHMENTMADFGCSNELAEAQECVCFWPCHQNLVEKYGLSFHEGTDRFTREGSHYGVHKHIHIAEDFSARALEIGM
jgi:hypothetical protein